MKIALSVQIYLQKISQSASSMEPIVYCGMYDCGLSYIFQLLQPLFASEANKGIMPVFSDVSNANSPEKTQKEIILALRSSFSDISEVSDYASLTESLQQIMGKTKLVLVLYLGQEGIFDPELLMFLHRMRNLFGWRFSYCLFLTTRFLLQSQDAEIIDNIVRQTATPVLPRSIEDSYIVIQNYEERWRKKIVQAQRDKIVKLSGGNPGLIKALFLQAVENPNWNTPDMLDERLFYRLKEIAADLPKEYIRVMLSGTKRKGDELIRHILVRYGYLVKKGGYTVFSPLFLEYMNKFVDKMPHSPLETYTQINQMDLQLTKSQRKVLAYLREHPGEIVSRDTLAQVLWGENWADKYSDWAIDQLLSVLRERLTKLRFTGKIVTKKGEGIIFLP